MYSGHRRWSARSNSEPPPPAPWALQQPPPSAVVDESHAVFVDDTVDDGMHSQPRPDSQPRGRPLARDHRDDPKTIGKHAVEAGLDTAVPAPSKGSKMNNGRSGEPPIISPFRPTQTFWIPFTLAPGSQPGVARLTPINRRVPAHLRAAASSLNLTMTYDKNLGIVTTESRDPHPSASRSKSQAAPAVRARGAAPAPPEVPRPASLATEPRSKPHPSLDKVSPLELPKSEAEHIATETVAAPQPAEENKASDGEEEATIIHPENCIIAPSEDVVPPEVLLEHPVFESTTPANPPDEEPVIVLEKSEAARASEEDDHVLFRSQHVVDDREVEAIPAEASSISPSANRAVSTEHQDTDGPTIEALEVPEPAASVEAEAPAPPSPPSMHTAPDIIPEPSVLPLDEPDRNEPSSNLKADPEVVAASVDTTVPIPEAPAAEPAPAPAADAQPTAPAPALALAEDEHPIAVAPVAEAPPVESAPADTPIPLPSRRSQRPKLSLVVPPSTANASTQGTIRGNPIIVAAVPVAGPTEVKEKTKRRKRSSLRQSTDAMNAAETNASSGSAAAAGSSSDQKEHKPPKATVGPPQARARSNTAVEVPPQHLSKTTPGHPATKAASRPSAMRKVQAQLAAQPGPAGNADGELDTDGEPSWAWDELIRQLDEEDELKSKLRTYYRPSTDGSTNVDAWWIAFQLAWDANMLRNRGVRTWWDIEHSWRPQDMFFGDGEEAAAPAPAAEPTQEEAAPKSVPVAVPVGKASPSASAKGKESNPTVANNGGEETLVSSPEHSPHRSDSRGSRGSRGSLKTLAAPGTNQSKRSTAPAAKTSGDAPEPHADIPEESAGHTTPTSLSSSITSSSSSSGSSSPAPEVETEAAPDADAARPSQPRPAATQTHGAEPVLNSSDFRTMWEEAEARWAEEEKEKMSGSGKDASAPASTAAHPAAHSASSVKAEASPSPAPTGPTAEERERARGRSKEGRSRGNTVNARPSMLQRETYTAGQQPQHDAHLEQERQSRPAMFARRQSEPAVALAVDPDSDERERERRGRNVRPKLHIDTDLTDYMKPKARAAPAPPPPRAQPVPQARPAPPPPQAQPVPPPKQNPLPQPQAQFQSSTAYQQPRAQSQSRPQAPPQAQPEAQAHSHAHPHNHAHTHSHAKPQSRAKQAPPPVQLRAVPNASQRSDSKISIAWRKYETGWEQMLAPASKEPITFASVPWPVVYPPRAYSSGAANSSEGDGLMALSTLSIAQFLLSPDHSPGIPARERLRAAIRRWHSDKFSRFANRMKTPAGQPDDGGSEKDKIMEGVGVVARALTQLLELERGD